MSSINPFHYSGSVSALDKYLISPVFGTLRRFFMNYSCRCNIGIGRSDFGIDFIFVSYVVSFFSQKHSVIPVLYKYFIC